MRTGTPAEHSRGSQTQGERAFTAVSRGAQDKGWGQE